MYDAKYFEPLTDDEQMEIDGGSTKVAAIICVVGGAVIGFVGNIAGATGHPQVAAWCAVASGACFVAAATLAVIPFI
ncbi:MAG: class IIb bacteriocin, lactobin A/cerein 7B family [Oscillospiraceae bacterium]|jgi:lactobin A/cerein 7B family class IIb bacteriocin|nr:class IIb bacteriocin, lactobin A/cerein 7B family [Oscillospiraceae bacterium]